MEGAASPLWRLILPALRSRDSLREGESRDDDAKAGDGPEDALLAQVVWVAVPRNQEGDHAEGAARCGEDAPDGNGARGEDDQQAAGDELRSGCRVDGEGGRADALRFEDRPESS